MDQDKQAKRVKVVNAEGHRTGSRHAAVKPHKRTTGADIKKLINDYLGGTKGKGLTQTYYGATVEKNAALLRGNFGLEASDEPYLLLDVTGGKAKAGMLLSETGMHLADGRGGTAAYTWKEFANQQLSYQNNMLVIGQSGIQGPDGKVLLPLLQQIQAKVANK